MSAVVRAAVLTIDRSARARTATSAQLRSLSCRASSMAATVAQLVRVLPPASAAGLTTIVTAGASAPAAMGPSVQDTTPLACPHVVPDGATETNTTLAGRTSVRVGAAAVSGPALWATSRYVMASPIDTRSWSAVFVTDTSAWVTGGGTTVTQVWDESLAGLGSTVLLAGSGSSWFPDTEAVLQIRLVNGPLVTVPTIVTTTLSEPSGRTFPWIVQSTALPATVQKSDGVDVLVTSADTTSIRSGRRSWIRIRVPGRGPLFVTVRVYVTRPPIATVAGDAVLVMARSALFWLLSAARAARVPAEASVRRGNSVAARRRRSRRGQACIGKAPVRGGN